MDPSPAATPGERPPRRLLEVAPAELVLFQAVLAAGGAAAGSR